MQTARIEALKKQASEIAALKQQAARMAALLGQLERAGTITPPRGGPGAHPLTDLPQVGVVNRANDVGGNKNRSHRFALDFILNDVGTIRISHPSGSKRSPLRPDDAPGSLGCPTKTSVPDDVQVLLLTDRVVQSFDCPTLPWLAAGADEPNRWRARASTQSLAGFSPNPNDGLARAANSMREQPAHFEWFLLAQHVVGRACQLVRQRPDGDDVMTAS